MNDSGRSVQASLPIEIRGVTKRYETVTALHSVDLSIRDGEFLTLLGPSGSGKTTMLMVLAGFISADEGSVLFGEEEVIAKPAHKRGVGVVFQSYALFPHMSVAQNVEYPLKVRKIPQEKRQEKVLEALELVHLGDLSSRRIDELSGGQKQRVALARALIFEPRILLMDEPLSALDKNLREQMQIEIKKLHRQFGMTTVYVTHDQREAMTMSDRIAVMRDGCIEQIDAPRRIYDGPVNAFVANFIGESTLIEVTVDTGNVFVGDKKLVVAQNLDQFAGGTGLLVLRPEKLQISRERPNDYVNVLPCTVGDVFDQGETMLITTRLLGGQELTVRQVASRESFNRLPSSGETAWLGVHEDDLVVVPCT